MENLKTYKVDQNLPKIDIFFVTSSISSSLDSSQSGFSAEKKLILKLKHKFKFRLHRFYMLQLDFKYFIFVHTPPKKTCQECLKENWEIIIFLFSLAVGGKKVLKRGRGNLRDDIKLFILKLFKISNPVLGLKIKIPGYIFYQCKLRGQCPGFKINFMVSVQT